MMSITKKGNIEALFFKIDPAIDMLDEATNKMVEMAKDKAPIAKEAYYESGRNKFGNTNVKIKRRPGRLKKNIKRTDRKKSFRVYIDMGTRGAPYGLFQEAGFTDRGGKQHSGKYFMAESYSATLASLSLSGKAMAKSCLTYQGHNNKTFKAYK